MREDTLTVLAPQIVTPAVPALIAEAGEPAAWRFVEFFTVHIRNPNTRAAYRHAAGVFLRWCEARGITELRQVQPIHVAAYIELLGKEKSKGERGFPRPR